MVVPTRQRKPRRKSRQKQRDDLLDLLQTGNIKLGNKFPNFSLPYPKTCICASDACPDYCYNIGTRSWTNVANSRERNYLASLQPNFVDRMIQELVRKRATRLRLQVDGDVYNVAYARKLVRIAAACKNVQIYMYTRTWARKDILKALIKFAELDNTSLWWSVDHCTHEKYGAPPKVPGVRVAYTQVDHSDIVIPSYVDLVFRVKRDIPAKRVDGCLVCPYENGIKKESELHCQDCMICVENRSIPRKAPGASTKGGRKLVQLT